MNMKKIIPFSLLVLFMTAGCKQLIIWKYGIKKPKTETPESILAFAIKQGQNPDNIYLFRDSVCFKTFMKDSLYKKAYFSAIVFNDKGLIMNYKDSASCQWSASAYIQQLKKDTVYMIDDSHKFSSIISSLTPLNGQNLNVMNAQNYDYTVVFTWAKYIGKLNERLFRINEFAKNNPYAKIRVISLNVDVQKSWALRENPKLNVN
jgi:hypothetical protein